MHVPKVLRVATGLLLVSAAACDDASRIVDSSAGSNPSSSATAGQFKFTPLPSSAVCGPSTEQPFLLPPGYTQTVIAREGDGGTLDLWDMVTQNETGPQAGRFLYHTHEIGSNGQVSVTDLETNQTRVLAQRLDWERLDGIAWTPWGTILAAEETTNSTLAGKDPALPAARAGHVYEINPETGASVLRAAVGSRSHEGLRFDSQGNLYGISESSPPVGGYIFKFVPARRGDLSSGQLYALKVVTPTPDRTGEAVWLPLNTAAAALDSDAEATRAGATGYGRPEDVEMFTSTGNGGGQVLYVAITSENRVLGVDLREPRGGRDHATAFVYDYVRAGVNAPLDFTSPDNLALDKAGNLYITEDPPGNPVGADIWVATSGNGGQHQRAESTVRFASLPDCAAEPSGIYFDKRGWGLFVHVQHRGGPDPRDLQIRIDRVE